MAAHQPDTAAELYQKVSDSAYDADIEPAILQSIQKEVSATQQEINRKVEHLKGCEERISVGLDSIQRSKIHATDLELDERDMALQSIKTVKFGYHAPFSGRFDPARSVVQHSTYGGLYTDKLLKERASSNSFVAPRTGSVIDSSLSSHLVVSVPIGAKQSYIPKRIPREMLASVNRPITFVNPTRSLQQPSAALESQAALNNMLSSIRASRELVPKSSVSPDKYMNLGNGIFSSRRSHDGIGFRGVGDYGSSLSQVERTYDARSGLHQLTDLVKRYKSTCSTFHDGCPRMSDKVVQLEASQKYSEIINPRVSLQNLYHVPSEVHRHKLTSLEKRNRCSKTGESKLGLLTSYEKVDRMSTIDRCSINLENIKAKQQLGTLLNQKVRSAKKPTQVREPAKDYKVPLSSRYAYTRSNVLTMALDRV